MERIKAENHCGCAFFQQRVLQMGISTRCAHFDSKGCTESDLGEHGAADQGPGQSVDLKGPMYKSRGSSKIHTLTFLFPTRSGVPKWRLLFYLPSKYLRLLPTNPMHALILGQLMELSLKITPNLVPPFLLISCRSSPSCSRSLLSVTGSN